MLSKDDLERLREHISRSVAERLLHDSSFNWTALQRLDRPVLCIQACLQDGPDDATTAGGIVSHVVDLTDIATPSRGAPAASGSSNTSAVQRRGAHKRTRSTCHASHDGGRITPPEDDEDGRAPSTHAPGEESATGQHRHAISGLRPMQAVVDVEPDSQRQIHSGDRFPKRRKQQPERHVLRPSSLDKLVQGIWEQIHGSLDLRPQNLLELVQPKALEGARHGETSAADPAAVPISPVPSVRSDPAAGENDEPLCVDRTRAFKQNNVFCSKVTQASRTCRSLEVIVQARWVEHFETYVDSLAALHANAPRTRFNKAALAEACADFGWSEKELRNKMSIWRGYSEIKDAGGWAALVFAGMGIYRFCKYRVGFDRDSMARLRALRHAFEMAADTLQPGWRALLAAVGEPTARVYTGHPHDFVVSLAGPDPVPLRLTYLQWDPTFSFRHIDECVVEDRAWPDCLDPRWAQPAASASSGLPVCDACGRDQSDDPRQNACACFPTLFGAAQTLPAPVLVFRTPDGRNNGLVALCPFERGAAVGEFVGLVTKGLADVDVMEGSTKDGARYQIWQGREGNFTRFVNHSCNANSQYQRFTWLGTQRVLLVSKGIEAGEEITVDYSDKYWRGLDKKCLCGESCCRYRREELDVGR